MMADRAPDGGAREAVMASEVAGDTTNRRAFETTRGHGRGTDRGTDSKHQTKIKMKSHSESPLPMQA